MEAEKALEIYVQCSWCHKLSSDTKVWGGWNILCPSCFKSAMWVDDE